MGTQILIEGLADSFLEHGVSATSDQIKKVAEDVELHFSVRDEYKHHGGLSAVSVLEEKIRVLEASHAEELRTPVCRICVGSGRLGEEFCGRETSSECHVCNGVGRTYNQ